MAGENLPDPPSKSMGRRAIEKIGEFVKGVPDSNVNLKFNQKHPDKPELPLWASSQERLWYLERRKALYPYVLASVGLFFTSALLAQPGWRTDRQLWWAAILTGVGILLLMYCETPSIAAHLAFREHRRKGKLYHAELAQHGLSDENGNIPLPRLFAVNRKQLDAYQDIAIRQQRRAFATALITSALGFSILTIGVITSLQINPASDKYVVAGLSGIGTLLAVYITNTFFALAKSANKRLDQYYDEPRNLGLLIMAERLANAYEADRDKAVNAGEIIDVLLKKARADKLANHSTSG